MLYVHGKGGSSAEAAGFARNCPEIEVIGVDYDGSAPWTARPGIRAAYDAARARYGRVLLFANSIGAYFSMLALQDCAVERALLISPVVDMERLILDMLGWAGATEDALRARGEIPTEFGETLSWAYLRYVRAHPMDWRAPTKILCARRDALVAHETLERFAARCGAEICTMEQGEHWFHTEAQLRFLDEWMRAALA